MKLQQEHNCPNCGCGNPKKTYDGYWCDWCDNEFYIKTNENI